MLKKGCFLFFCFLFSSMVSMPSIAVPVNILGFDDMSCSAWVRSKDDEDMRRLYLMWIRGVLTGHNYANQSQQVSVVSDGTVEKFIDRFCKENSKAQFSDGALRMSDRYSGRNKAITR